MNISFQNNQKHISPNAYNDYMETNRTTQVGEKPLKDASDTVNVNLGERSFKVPGALDWLNEGHEKSKTFAELQQEAAYADVGVSQDYMTLMSHTMSDVDYNKLSEEGFDFSAMNPEEAVTIVDKIKAELVRSGQHIAGYTDDLNMDTLAAAVGSDTLARAISDSFHEADIPLTTENVAAVGRAWNMASELTAPTEGSIHYMLENELEPEIANFYLAQSSGVANAQAGKVTSENYPMDEQLQKQVDKVLEQAGYEVDEQGRDVAKWILSHNIPLTEESLNRFHELKEAVVPITKEAFVKAVTGALTEGKSPIYGNLSKDYEHRNLYEKAVEVLVRWQADTEGLVNVSDITARKQLEEIRLRMTAEVNVKLLKSGFVIDTAPMEDLIQALYQAEKEVAEGYFPQETEAVSNYQNWNRTNQIMSELPGLPAQILGTVRLGEAGEDATVLSRFHSEGMILRQTYIQAGESYEALMTAPRADLGDSMKKAFSNVDELARQMGLEPTEENSRIIRILGYNHMAINEENFKQVQEADRQVRTVIQKMTPAATLQMIRDGVNPLEASFTELNEYFDRLPKEYHSQAESYSKYLYGLEQNQQITDAERETYIGVYRLLHQIEKQDGAAIGAVVNSQAQVEFANLLSAVRSGKFKHMDVRATDELGVLKELVQKGESRSISDQIMESYRNQQFHDIQKLARMDASVPALLQRGEIPVTAENLLATQDLLQDRNNPFKACREKAKVTEIETTTEQVMDAEESTSADDLWEQLDAPKQFRESYTYTMEELQVQTEELTFAAETSLDVKMLQTTHRQLGIMGDLARSQEYFLPMQIGDEAAMVHLTFDSSAKTKGEISIAVKMGESSHMEAHLRVQNHRLEGYLVGKTSFEVTKLQEAADIFYNLINENASVDLEAAPLPVVSRENTNMTGTSESGSQGEEVFPDNGTLYRVAKLFLQAMK